MKNNNNNEGNEAGGDATAVQGGQDAEPEASASKGNANASNYDATKVRKSKRRTDSEVWQDKILKCLEPVDVPEPAKKD